MATKTYISDVTGKSNNWRVKVLVLEKSNPYTTEKKKARLQKILLMDEQGGKVEAVLWNASINVHEKSLLPFMTYIVGGARVQSVKQGMQYNTPGITTRWNIPVGTYIHEVTDEREMIPYPTINLATISDIRSVANTLNTIDIVLVITDVRQPRLVEAKGKLTPIRECIVMQNELTPLTLTLWGDFVEDQGALLYTRRHDKPIILCKHLKADTYSGLSLSTIPFSFVSIDPPIPEVASLREWLEQHTNDVENTTARPPQTYLENALKNKEPLQMTLLSSIQPSSQVATCEVTMCITDTDQEVCYTVCPKCNKTQKALSEESFLCYTCDELQIAAPKCKVITHITDGSRTVPATMFDRNAERLLGLTATEAHKMNDKALAEHMHYISNTLKDKQIIVRIKAPQEKFTDKLMRYTIHEWTQKTSLEPTTDTQKSPGNTTTTEQGTQSGTTKMLQAEGGSSKTTTEKRQNSPPKSAKGITDNEPPSTPEKAASPMKKLKQLTPEKN